LIFFGGERMIMFLIMSSKIVLNLKDNVLATVSAINDSFDIMSSINKQLVSRWRGLVGELLSEILMARRWS
jgi:hypothetical protein